MYESCGNIEIRTFDYSDTEYPFERAFAKEDIMYNKLIDKIII